MVQIKKRRFGRTELQIPEVTYGGGWVGGLLITADQATAHATLNKALASGIDWIDTAAAYGDGVSESVIGGWLKTLGTAPRPRLSTKFNIDTTAGDFRGQVRRSLEASLGRLRLDKVELLILHNRVVNRQPVARGPRELLPHEVLEAGGVADIMDELKREGLIDHLGLTGLGEPAALSAVVDSGRFDVAQIYYNALNPSAFEDMPENWNSTHFHGLGRNCVAQDMGIMGIRIFAAGHLATDVRHGREIPITENAENVAEEARVKAFVAAIGDLPETRAQTALRFGLGCEALSTIVVGIGEPEHFEQVLGAAEMGPLDGAVCGKISELWRQHAAFQR
ncbi:MAG: aldo/keto reductase [Hyphomicrobiaceae bacterium]